MKMLKNSLIAACMLLTLAFTTSDAADEVRTHVDNHAQLHVSFNHGYEWTTLAEHVGLSDAQMLRYHIDDESRVHYSTDAGASWQVLGARREQPVDPAVARVQSITIPQVITYVNGKGEAWLSIDGGYEWFREEEFDRRTAEPVVVREAPSLGQDLTFQPHPLEGSAAAVLRLHARSLVYLKIFDLSGREVAVLAKGYLDAGEHRLPLDANILEQGFYSYTLQIDGTVKQGTVSVAR